MMLKFYILLTIACATAYGKASVNSAACTKAHNAYRPKHHVGNLKWDPTIAKFAQAWADNIGKGKEYGHNPDRRREGYGENWYANGGCDTTCKKAVDSWYGEVKKYDYAAGYQPGTGHFTQLVWKESAKFGCGIACTERGQFLVCDYFPGGNYASASAHIANVLKP